MKKSFLKLSAVVLAGLLSLNANPVQAQRSRFNGFASAVFMTVNGDAKTFNVTGRGADLIAPNGSHFSGSNIGTFVQNSASLWFMGSEIKTYKQSGANVCGVSIAYGIRSGCYACAGVPSTEMPLYFKVDCDNGVFADGYGPCSFGDQKWKRDDTGVDLTNRPPGTYWMEVYYNLKGSDFNPSECGKTVNYGAYYAYEDGYYSTDLRATFTIVAPTAAKSAGGNVVGLAATTNDAASLSVYPSPATSNVSIDPVNFNEGAVQMEITNIQGSTTKKIAEIYTKGQNISLDMSSYAAGMYFVRLSQGSKTAVAKVVKQ